MKLWLMMVIVLTGCNTHHSFMDKALVGYVDSQHAVVVFPAGERNGVKYYRSQFASECSYNKYYQDDDSSIGCMIRESRLVDLHPYIEHKSKVIVRQVDNNHDNFDNVNSLIHIPDNI